MVELTEELKIAIEVALDEARDEARVTTVTAVEAMVGEAMVLVAMAKAGWAVEAVVGQAMAADVVAVAEVAGKAMVAGRRGCQNSSLTASRHNRHSPCPRSTRRTRSRDHRRRSLRPY